MWTRALFVLLALWLTACSGDDKTTSVLLEVEYDSTWQLDRFNVSLADKQSSIEARSDVRLLVGDDMGGQTVTIKIDGLRADSVIAHGEIDVTLSRGEEVGAKITLLVLEGPSCVETMPEACDEIPEPTCLSATTLRTAVGPGVCEDGVCKYVYADIICDNGCANNACICDNVTEQSGDVVELTTVVVDRVFAVNGSAVPDTTVNGYGEILLRNVVTGDEVPWGYTYQASVPIPVLPGLYDVFYENINPGTGAGMAITVPRNKRARIATGVDLTTAKTLDIDIDAVMADRTFKVNGAFVPDSTANGYGRLFLRNTATGDEVAWGYTYDATNPVQVAKGTYEVFYEMASTGTGAGGVQTVPRNTKARISNGASITTTTPLALDVQVVSADRVFRVNNSAVPDSTANGYGILTLRNVATGDAIDWGATYTASLPRPIIAGTYDVFYKSSSIGTGAGGVITVPRNSSARIAQGVTINSTTPLDLSVTAVKVDRTFKVNGTAVTDSTVNGYGNLYIRNTATGDEILWGQTYDQTEQLQLISGSYDIYYEASQFGSGAGGATTVPRNKKARLAVGAMLTSTAPLALDVSAVKVDRVFKVNGAVLVDTTINGYGRLFIRNAAGDEIDWCYIDDSSVPLQIISGTYDVIYENVGAGTGAGMAPMVPRNKKARVAAAASLTTTTPLVLDMTVVKVDREVRVNGLNVPDTTVNGYGNVLLRSSTTTDELGWGATYQASMRLPVLAGKYDRAYEMVSKGSGAGGAMTVPQNTRARLSCVDVH